MGSHINSINKLIRFYVHLESQARFVSLFGSELQMLIQAKSNDRSEIKCLSSSKKLGSGPSLISGCSQLSLIKAGTPLFGRKSH